MFTDDELIPISALQHFMFCNRRAALVHLEGLWAENQITIEGRHLHERADDPSKSQKLSDVRIDRAMELRSNRWGLVGKADVCEFRKSAIAGRFEVTIIEYKRGKPRKRLDKPFQIQLCAQALCLEDMLGYSVDNASIYYGMARMRLDVPLDDALRECTASTILELQSMLRAGRTPTAKYEPRKCSRCSLFSLCMPQILRPRATATKYLESLIQMNESD